MFRPAITTLLVICCSTITGQEPDEKRLNQSFQNVIRPYLKSYCLDCHGNEEPEAKLDLSGYSTASNVSKAHQKWAIVLERIEAGEMPPKDFEPQPTPQQNSAVVKWIRDAREFEATRNAGDPGIVLARRLSNAEYNYTIRDLTGVDIRPTDSFPIDSANEAGFDNSGESLTMSPALLNKYLQAARQVTEHLVLLPDGVAFAPHPVVTNTDRDKYCVKRIVDFYRRQPVDLADYFFAAWQYQRLLDKQASIPSIEAIAHGNNVSPKYLRTVVELLTDRKPAVGPIEKLQSMWRELPANGNSLNAARIQCESMRKFVVKLRHKLVPDVEMIGVDGVHKGSQTFVLWRNRQRAANRRSFAPSVLQAKQPNKGDDDKKQKADDDLLVPSDAADRKRHEAAFSRFCDVFPDAFFISERGRDYVKASSKQQGEKGRLLSAGFHSMLGYFRDDGPLYDLVLDAGEQRELDRLWQQLDFIASAPMRQYASFLWFERTDSRFMREARFDFARPEDKNAQSALMIQKLADVYLQKARDSGGEGTAIEAIEHYFHEINNQIRWVETARQAAEESHLVAVTDFAERAYRRPLSMQEPVELRAFYRSLRDDEGLNHEEAIRDVMVSVLMSPHFCYRIDMAASTEAVRPLSSHELASRLSFFLWASMPDAELLQAAEQGNLKEAEVLMAQIRRMLQDDRVRGLAVEFAGNWLDVRRFEQHNSVDRERFPEFSDDLRQAMFEEPIRYFMNLIQQDQSLNSLLDSDHTFINTELAKHYGVVDADIANQDWVRLDEAKAYGRGGLLPMSVFLTKNAPGLRTSPVKRGYWVVRRLLGERIPPPPPNVSELPDDESNLGDLTLREALAKHRDHASCAGCHERIDSIGLVFEGYGPVGERRQNDLGGNPVDTTAILPGGHKATSVNELQRYLTEQRGDEFVDNVIRKLLSYALGRSLILSDDLLVRDIHQRLRNNNYRFSILVEGIVTSQQFLNKRGKVDVQ